MVASRRCEEETRRDLPHPHLFFDAAAEYLPDEVPSYQQLRRVVAGKTTRCRLRQKIP
jgi:hypothetical protein